MKSDPTHYRDGAAESDRVCVVILGMHRSGTSMITRLISLLGASLPQNIATSTEENEFGYWESEPLYKLNDEILAAAGSQWDDWRRFDTNDLTTEEKEDAIAQIAAVMQAEFGNSDFFVLKDPRICQMLPLYDEAFRRSGISPVFINIFRNPLAVQRSLERRNGFTAAFCALLWLRYTLEAEWQTRSHKRVFVLYDSLIEDWRKEISRISDSLDVDWRIDPEDAAAAIEDFVSPALRHHQFELADIENSHHLPTIVKETYPHYLALTASPFDPETLEAIDAIRTGMDTAAEVCGNASMAELIRRERYYQVELKNHGEEIRRLKDTVRGVTALHEARRIVSIKNKCLEHELVHRTNELRAAQDHIAAIFASRTWRLVSILQKGYLVLRLATKSARFFVALRIFRILEATGLLRDRQLPAILFGDLNKLSLGKDSVDFRDRSYTNWIANFDTLSESTRSRIRKNIERFAYRPLISILMPTYNTPVKWLERAIQSIEKQLYENWELCIADDASTSEDVKELLRSYAEKDPRVKVTFRNENGHISLASNSALKIATGDYIALFDHDDELAEHALYWIVTEIVAHPSARLVYSDEDKIGEDSTRFDPYFKSDFNYELMLSHNMVAHLGVYHAETLRELGGFREGFEGAQDYDLALRFIDKVSPENIRHIPRILYHWRVHSGSTASNGQVKPYAMQAAKRAIEDHFKRRNISAEISPAPVIYGMQRIRFSVPEPQPRVSLIIPTRNGYDLLKKCVDRILERTAYSNYDIIIVDNGSDDPTTLEYFGRLQEIGNIRVLCDDRPFNFSALNNNAVEKATGEIVALVNNDIEVLDGQWLDEMVSHAVRPDVGAVGARLLYPDNRIQHGGVVVGIGGVAGHAHKGLDCGEPGYFGKAQLTQTVSAVTAACLAIRKSTYLGIGGLNEELSVAFNDVDFCLRVRDAGFRNIWTPYATLYHRESATRGAEDSPEKQKRFQKEIEYMIRRWGQPLTMDPYYNPNLSLEREDFSLAWPPRVEIL